MSSKSRGPGSGWRFGTFVANDGGSLRRGIQDVLGTNKPGRGFSVLVDPSPYSNPFFNPRRSRCPNEDVK